MFSIVTPETTRYRFDELDRFLFHRLTVPHYWEAREMARAWSEEHIEPNGCTPKEALAGFVCTGKAGHLALTMIGGAVFHLEQLERLCQLKHASLESGYPPHFIAWEELEGLFNDLYSARNGMVNFAYNILAPTLNGNYEGRSWKTVAPFFCSGHSSVHNALDYCDGLVIRHRAVHRYRNFIYSARTAEGGLRFFLPQDIDKPQTTVVPPASAVQLDAFTLSRKIISTFERRFDSVFEYLTKGSHIEAFIARLGVTFTCDSPPAWRGYTERSCD